MTFLILNNLGIDRVLLLLQTSFGHVYVTVHEGTVIGQAAPTVRIGYYWCFACYIFTGFMAASRGRGASDILCLPRVTSRGTPGTQPSSSTIEPIKTSLDTLQPCVACFREGRQFHGSCNFVFVCLDIHLARLYSERVILTDSM